MTSDEFTAQYRLLKRITREGGRSYTAEHRSSGRAVLIHFLDDETPVALSRWTVGLAQLPPRDKARVLEATRVDRSFVVVTQVLEGFQTFERWLETRAPASPPPADVPAPAASPPGEFTKLFHGCDDPSALAPAPPADTPARSALEPQAPPPPPPAVPSFSDLFRRPGGDTSDAEPAEAGVPAPMRMDPSPAPPLVLQQQEPPIVLPNLGSSAERGMNPAGPLPPPVLGGEIINAPEPPPVPPQPERWSGASEFSRQLRRRITRWSTVAPLPPGDNPPVEPAVPRKLPLIPLLLALNLIVIIATGLIVYFALKHC